MSTLVIVESPAKARTIGKFLGRRYKVKASMGHVRDLPKSQFGVDLESGNFTPKYITVRGQGKTLQELRKAAKKADKVLLATDPDREGEAISWHLASALKLDEPERIVFHEITKEAIKRALKDPRHINMSLVDAQQARRVLDRLVGYKLSPFLWAKVKPGLSAGRVQSPALRLICDREAEVQAFTPEEYWSVGAWLAKSSRSAKFLARLTHCGAKKCQIDNGEQAAKIEADLKAATFTVTKVNKGERRRKPPAPFTTSTMQQEAVRKLSFTARRSMSVAQQLYEGLDIGEQGTVGLITYLRTDSTSVASEAQNQARDFIDKTWGSSYKPKAPPRYKTRKGAQEAHEAIRPTSVERTPEALKPFLDRGQYLLYKLIWERFVASQMSPAVFDTIAVDIAAASQGEDAAYRFRATGSTMRFAGFMKVYVENTDEEEDDSDEGNKQMPDLSEGDVLVGKGIETKQHFTQPPPRYTEAMLVRTLEELGLGRPSTYVSIIETLQRRGYVTKIERRFSPTELGQVTVELLKEHFPDVVDVEFTANMEENLDHIEDEEVDWVDVLKGFYRPFADALEEAHANAPEVQLEDEETDIECDKCGRNMVIKWGRFGKFLACPGYPECKNTKPILEEIGVACPKCGEGQLVQRRSRRGRTFYGCNRYPDCDFTSWQKPVSHRCPECGSYMVEKSRRGVVTDWVCANKECGFAQKPETSNTEAGSANGAVRKEDMSQRI